MPDFERDHNDVGAYYDQEVFAQAEATGAGLIWFMGRDHLSPPLSNEDQYALNSSRWREASSQRVLELATHMGIGERDKVADLGCGVGGPGRDIVAKTGAYVVGVSISLNQLKNLQILSGDSGSVFEQTVKADMQQLPFASASLDHAYAVNSIYHVNNSDNVTNEAYRTLHSDGAKFGVDDWFTTNATTDDELAKLRHNWSTGSSGFHNIDRFTEHMEDVGFRIFGTRDFTSEAGAFLSEERFGATYDAQIAPTLRTAFPQLYHYDGYKPEHADMAVHQLREDILYMGELYRSGAAVYRQIIGVKD